MKIIDESRPVQTRDAGSIPGLGRSLEKEMATHSIILAWETPRTEEPHGVLATGLCRVGHNWRDLACIKAKLQWVLNGAYRGGSSRQDSRTCGCQHQALRRNSHSAESKAATGTQLIQPKAARDTIHSASGMGPAEDYLDCPFEENSLVG